MKKQNHSPKRTTPKDNSGLVSVKFQKPSEFNLSERIINQEPEKWERGYPIFHESILLEDVAEAVRLLKEEFKTPYGTIETTTEDVFEVIDKIFGEKLT